MISLRHPRILFYADAAGRGWGRKAVGPWGSAPLAIRFKRLFVIHAFFLLRLFHIYLCRHERLLCNYTHDQVHQKELARAEGDAGDGDNRGDQYCPPRWRILAPLQRRQFDELSLSTSAPKTMKEAQ